MTFIYHFEATIGARDLEWDWEYQPFDKDICKAMIEFYRQDTGTSLSGLTKEEVAIKVWEYYETPDFKEELIKEYGSVANCVEEAKVYLASRSKYHRPEPVDAAAILKYMFDDVDAIAGTMEDELKDYFEAEAEYDWQHNRDYE